MKSIEELMKSEYNIDVLNLKKLEVGAGSNTYYIESDKGKYILKNPATSEINNPRGEIDLCDYLLERNIPVSVFIKNKEEKYLCIVDGECYHLQKYIDGINYGLNEAPEWLMLESAKLLGKINSELKTYPNLAEGIGRNFFELMTPQRAKESYLNTLIIAENNREKDIVEDLRYRIELMDRFPYPKVNVEDLSCGNTHGDYFIRQIIAKDNKIAGVIDWTTACRHPYVWGIIRSFVYGEPSCKDGNISIEKLLVYISEYLKYNKLMKKDLILMPVVFYYQIAVCDYYNQFYQSVADNKNIYLHQAKFSTKLMKWFDNNMDTLISELKSIS